MWARWAYTSLVFSESLVLYTIGDNCEQATWGPRHGSSSFGSVPSASWYGLYTKYFLSRLEHGVRFECAATVCLFVCSLG